MEQFELNILGCGAAVPAEKRLSSSQVLNSGSKLYMIDCCEGAQMQFRAMKLRMSRLNHIFLSHLHGDHCLGLPPLIFTMQLSERTTDLHIHAKKDAAKIFQPVLDYFCGGLPFRVIFNDFDPAAHAIIFEDQNIKVSAIPLLHAVPTAGFLFEQKAKSPMPAKKYAYCSDTIYTQTILPMVDGVDLLYHEATFAQNEHENALRTMHTTAAQAAQIAKLAHVKRLLIGHHSARYADTNILLEEAKEIFPNTMLAAECDTIII